MNNRRINRIIRESIDNVVNNNNEILRELQLDLGVVIGKSMESDVYRDKQKLIQEAQGLIEQIAETNPDIDIEETLNELVNYNLNIHKAKANVFLQKLGYKIR